MVKASKEGKEGNVPGPSWWLSLLKFGICFSTLTGTALTLIFLSAFTVRQLLILLVVLLCLLISLQLARIR